MIIILMWINYTVLLLRKNACGKQYDFTVVFIEVDTFCRCLAYICYGRSYRTVLQPTIINCVCLMKCFMQENWYRHCLFVIYNCLYTIKRWFISFLLDEEQEYPSSELNSHGPAVVGWRSRAESSLSPKEIIVRFDQPAIISRIQVLAHQFMIRKLFNLQFIFFNPEIKNNCLFNSGTHRVMDSPFDSRCSNNAVQPILRFSRFYSAIRQFVDEFQVAWAAKRSGGAKAWHTLETSTERTLSECSE